MSHDKQRDVERYTTADLDSEMLTKLTKLEGELQSDSNEEIILIAYKENQE